MRKFGQFTAVDHVSFEVRRREIFGLLGPNGAGKTTTFRMLCGLLPATSGTLQVAGVDLRTARASARQRIGYVAQKFSLYGQLTVTENLELLRQRLRPARPAAARSASIGRWRSSSCRRSRGLPSGQLPGGYKQRLAMAAALMHEPEILFLDEPTSGADPLARREFWRRITALSGEGVTVIVTTHFMEEAEYCDRAVIQDAGRILAQGTPAELRAHAEAADRRADDGGRLHRHRRAGARQRPRRSLAERGMSMSESAPTAHFGKARRIRALILKESRQIIRDPSSIAIAVVMPAILILLFGFALSLDVKNVPIAVVLEDPSLEARDVAAGFQLSPLFRAALRDLDAARRAADARAAMSTASSASAPISPAG